MEIHNPFPDIKPQEKSEPLSGSSADDLLFNFLEQLNSLLDVREYKDIRTFLTEFLKRSKTILGTDFISVYHLRIEKLLLTKLAAIERKNPFPQTLPLEDFLEPYQPDLWFEDQKPVSELQRYAKKAGLKYIISYPLGKGQEFFGLIAAGGYEMPADNLQLKKMALISSVIEGVIQKQIVTDTMQSRLEEISKLHDSRNLVFNNTKEGVLLVDPDLRVIELNTAAEQMLGYSQKEVLQVPVLDVLVGADGLIDALEVAGAGIETRELGVVSLHRRNGQAFSAHIQLFPVLDHRDALRAVVILVADESENEQNRIRVQHLEQRAALGGLSAIFAHEVRNPINNISTAVQLLKVRIPPEEPNYEVLNRIQSDLVRLNTLMDSVLAFSRPIEAKLKTVNISTYLQILLERWRPRFERLNIHFIMQKPKKDLFVMADPRLLEQIFTNLISNAVDVMDQTGGSLAVRVSRNTQVVSQSQIEVAISDTGPGIPDDIIEKIFEPFVSTKPKGTGLGLAITKHMVTAQRGTIHVSSFPGGSVFYVNLPEHRGE